MQQRLAQLRRLRRRALRADHCGTHNAGAKQSQPKALFRSTAPALLRSSGDDSKAAQLRQPLPIDIASCQMFFFFSALQVRWFRAPAFGVAARPSESSPEERSASGAVEGLPV